MTTYHANRRMTLNGKTYEKNARVPMNAQQFSDLEPTGFVRAEKKIAGPGDTKSGKVPEATTE